MVDLLFLLANRVLFLLESLGLLVQDIGLLVEGVDLGDQLLFELLEVSLLLVEFLLRILAELGLLLTDFPGPFLGLVDLLLGFLLGILEDAPGLFLGSRRSFLTPLLIKLPSDEEPDEETAHHSQNIPNDLHGRSLRTSWTG